MNRCLLFVESRVSWLIAESIVIWITSTQITKGQLNIELVKLVSVWYYAHLSLNIALWQLIKLTHRNGGSVDVWKSSCLHLTPWPCSGSVLFIDFMELSWRSDDNDNYWVLLMPMKTFFLSIHANCICFEFEFLLSLGLGLCTRLFRDPHKRH